MPISRQITSGTNWSVIIAAGALVLALASNVLSVVSGGTEKLEKRVSQIESDLAWKFASKEIVAKDIGFIDRQITELKTSKTDRAVYDQEIATLRRIQEVQRGRLRDLDHSVNQTFNARDALSALQARILELERAGRGK